jgi:hypothetical protein
MKFGGHTNRGTTSDQNVINSGMAKNKIDIQYPQSKTIPTNQGVHCYGKRALEKGKLNNSDNPIGRDTIGKLCSKDNACYELSVKEELSDLINSYKKSRWNNDGK